MRFKKGSKVEVFSDKGVPFGAWRCAAIILGNGHTYSVKYDSSMGLRNELVMERVSRKKIRPCPPHVSVERWEAGDLVEVLDDLFWRIATVLNDIGGDNYRVKLLGVPKVFSVHKINTRIRQSWQDDKWLVIGKVSGSEKYTRTSGLRRHQKSRSHAKLEMVQAEYSLAIQNDNDFQESNIVSTRLLKREDPLYSSSYAESGTGNPKKRSIEKQYWQRVMPGCPSLLPQKVDVAYPQKTLGKTYTHMSFNNHINGYCEMDQVKSNCFSAHLDAGSSQRNDYFSDVCSVGSCSVISFDEGKMPSRILGGSSQDADSLSSDAESFCHGDEEKHNDSLRENGTTRIHRSELDAYRSTLGALFASGPLSWEREASLTDLRQSLNISDDEHLTELRNLISAGTSS